MLFIGRVLLLSITYTTLIYYDTVDLEAYVIVMQLTTRIKHMALITLDAASVIRNASVWRPSVSSSVSPIFFLIILQATKFAHTQRDSSRA